MNKIIAIDPGKLGGIAVMQDGEVLEAHRLEAMTEQDIWQTLATHEPATVYLEKVGATPQMGTVSAFTFGESNGSLCMAVIAAGLRLETVTPQKWQKSLGLKKIPGGIGKNDTAKKRRNKAKAQELFPALKITNAIADALLIAEYGWRETAKCNPTTDNYDPGGKICGEDGT